MRNLILGLLLLFPNISSWAGLPPTTTKGTADSSNVTTFNIDFGAIPVTHSGVTATVGTIPTAKGGTNLTSYSLGDILYSSATNVLAKLGIGSAGQMLTVSSGIPGWTNPGTSIPTGAEVTITSASYTLLTTEAMVRVDTTSNAISIQLPNPATTLNGGHRCFYIKDVGGNLGTNQLTLLRNGSEKIENVAASKIFYSPFGGWFISTDGTNWWIN